MSVLIREATVQDLQAIMLIERECFINDAWPEAMMRDELQAAHTYYIVALLEDVVVGYRQIFKPSLPVLINVVWVLVKP